MKAEESFLKLALVQGIDLWEWKLWMRGLFEGRTLAFIQEIGSGMQNFWMRWGAGRLI